MLAKRLRRHPIWRREPFSYGQAWADLIMLANDRARTVTVNGESFELKRGQLAWSLRRLEIEWDRSGEWVAGFLKFCRDQSMVRVNSSRRHTIITILNYEAYNHRQTVTEPDTETVTEPDTETVTETGTETVSKTGTEPGTTTEQKVEVGRKEGGNWKEEDAREPHFRESISDEVVLQFAADWGGEMATGTPVIDPVWTVQWLARINGRREWPGNWRRCLVSQWRAEWMKFRSEPSVNGVLTPNVAAIDRQKKIAALSQEEDELAYEINAMRQSNIEVPAEKLARLASVRMLIKAL